MSHMGYVLLGWSFTALSLLGYATCIIKKGKKLSLQIEPEERRWS